MAGGNRGRSASRPSRGNSGTDEEGEVSERRSSERVRQRQSRNLPAEAGGLNGVTTADRTTSNGHHENEMSLKCSEDGCESTFPLKSGLERHALALHDRYMCKDGSCIETFESHNARVSHESTHNRVDPGGANRDKYRLSCPDPECNTTFAGMQGRRRHVRKQHKMLPCNMDNCLEAFETTEELERHKLEPHRDRPARNNRAVSRSAVVPVGSSATHAAEAALERTAESVGPGPADAVRAGPGPADAVREVPGPAGAVQAGPGPTGAVRAGPGPAGPGAAATLVRRQAGAGRGGVAVMAETGESAPAVSNAQAADQDPARTVSDSECEGGSDPTVSDSE